MTKALSEMSEEEIIAEIKLLRERRAQARESRRVSTENKKAKKDEVIYSEETFDAIFGE